ncbi:MAG: site-specific integrase [Treponema sp.]|jgi:site-specific recombinase XerD|nr:site-specific integrase [Treponema sp.]
MDTVYLFYENGSVAIPMTDFDMALFKRLTGIGRWDEQNSRFILSCRLKANQYSALFTGRPYVEVKENSPIAANGFFGRPWDGQQAAADKLNKTDRTCLASIIPLPEKLSHYWMEKLREELHSRKYSLKTIKSYLHFNRDLCRVLRKPAEQITGLELKRYLYYLDTVKDLSSSSMNLAISAIRFFYNNVMGRCFDEKQYRPRQDKRLPGVLSKTEIELLLNAEPNPKHRLLLMLTYSSGLRVSEVVALKKENIDISRKVIYIRQSKGRKDRFTLLSDKAAQFISKYCASYHIQTWLFPGQPATRPLTIRSAQHIFNKAVHHSGILKKVSIHSLRHTFATHLLESGTDIRYIQELLGHSTIRTTERYTHVARQNVLGIQSPLDTI